MAREGAASELVERMVEGVRGDEARGARARINVGVGGGGGGAGTVGVMVDSESVVRTGVLRFSYSRERRESLDVRGAGTKTLQDP